jgi:hypothetical protein
MVAHLKHRYEEQPERMVDELWQREQPFGPIPFKMISERAQMHKYFGPWIGFKIADMVDRVLGHEVSFDNAAVFMFKDPMKAAYTLWRYHNDLPETARPKDEASMVNGVVDYLKEQFSDLKAPPLGDRPIDLQEVETVLCKWKSHMNGHYPLMNDIDEINAGLEEWEHWSEAAKEFKAVMPGKQPEVS